MTFAPASSDAIAEAAFRQYADACAYLRRTGHPVHARDARRAWWRFAEAYLTPDEFAAIKDSALPADRGRA